MSSFPTGLQPCKGTAPEPPPRLIALTGGPGAGKTAVLEMASRAFCRHVAVLPEAAGIVFGGGFPRSPAELVRRASQRAIFRIQQEIEGLAIAEGEAAVALCDRGTLDGVAYWPGTAESFFTGLGTNAQEQLQRYAAVIHLETPGADSGYDRSNALRIETPSEARAIDARIAEAWNAHPQRVTIPSTTNFIDKALMALSAIRAQLPESCRLPVQQ